MQVPGSIRKWRTTRGMKQGTVAAHLAMSQQSFSELERNLTCLSLNYAEKLAELFAVPLTEIYYDAEILPPPAADPHKRPAACNY